MYEKNDNVREAIEEVIHHLGKELDAYRIEDPRPDVVFAGSDDTYVASRGELVVYDNPEDAIFGRSAADVIENHVEEAMSEAMARALSQLAEGGSDAEDDEEEFDEDFRKELLSLEASVYAINASVSGQYTVSELRAHVDNIRRIEGLALSDKRKYAIEAIMNRLELDLDDVAAKLLLDEMGVTFNDSEEESYSSEDYQNAFAEQLRAKYEAEGEKIKKNNAAIRKELLNMGKESIGAASDIFGGGLAIATGLMTLGATSDTSDKKLGMLKGPVSAVAATTLTDKTYRSVSKVVGNRVDDTIKLGGKVTNAIRDKIPTAPSSSSKKS